ncbi:MAG: tail fiber domain-containing protein [Panacibacter sp.]
MKKNLLLSSALVILTASSIKAQNTFPANGNVGIGTLAPVTSLQVVGTSRTGGANNYAQFDANGNLSFKGNAAYNVAGNRYAFQFSGNPNYGLFFNTNTSQYEFRDGNARPVFQVDVNLGNGIFNGGVRVGNSAVLSSGNIRWNGNDFEGYDGSAWKSFTATGWSLTGNAGTSSANNFLGTTDAQPLVFKVNNQRAGYIDNGILRNTSFGYKALALNTTGYSNIAIGNSALANNTSGWSMIAIGDSALYKMNTTGLFASTDIAIGTKALYNNQGNGNLALGVEALRDNSNGDRNVAIGDLSLQTNFYGSYNTALGSSAFEDGNIGDYNTAIGFNAGTTGPQDINNATALGSNAIVDASNKVRIGNTSVTSIGGQVGWTNFSDARVKKDIKENVPGLSFIRALRAVTYHYSIDKEIELLGKTSDTKDWAGKRDLEKINFTGFLAQEVDAAAKNVGYDFSGVDKTGKIMGLRYAEFVVPLVKAVQELSKMNDDKDAVNKVQQQQISDLQERLNKIEAMLNAKGSISSTASENQTVPVTSALLEQNRPNPFANSTVINYSLPVTTSNAFIIITDNNGKTIKQINVSGGSKGSITLDAASLSSGTYFYSLMVNGKMAGTKTMIAAK